MRGGVGGCEREKQTHRQDGGGGEKEEEEMGVEGRKEDASLHRVGQEGWCWNSRSRDWV